ETGIEAEAEDPGRRALEEEQPLPPGKAPGAVELEQQTGQGRADHGGGWNRHKEASKDAGAVGGRKPRCQVECDARKEARLGNAEQEAHDVEAPDVIDEGHHDGEQAPGDHDARDPHPRAEPVEREVAGNLEQAVAEKEDARAATVLGRRQPEVLVHRERGEADISAVEIVDDIGDRQQWKQPNRSLSQDLLLQRVHGCVPPLSTQYIGVWSLACTVNREAGKLPWVAALRAAIQATEEADNGKRKWG